MSHKPGPVTVTVCGTILSRAKNEMISKILCCAALFACSAYSLNVLNFVASNGVDNPTCGARTAPCRTFAGALANTSSGGTIKAVDAADYSLGANPLVLSIPIVIDGTGTGAAYLASSDAFVVQPSVGSVTIRGLAIVGARGVTVTGGSVHIEDVVIDASIACIDVNSGDFTAERVTLVNSNFGVSATGGRGVIRNSVIRGNSNTGVSVDPFSGQVLLTIDHTEISHNGTGISVDGRSQPVVNAVRLSNSVVTQNLTGLRRFRNGQIFSYGNNVIEDNGTDGTTSALSSLK